MGFGRRRPWAPTCWQCLALRWDIGGWFSSRRILATCQKYQNNFQIDWFTADQKPHLVFGMVWQHGDLIAGWPCYILKQVKIVLPQSFLGFGWFWILLRDELSSDADDIECSDEPLNVSLTISGLEAFHGMATKNPTGEEHDDRMTSYDKNGINRERIKRAVRSPSCKCKCTVPLQLMLKICAAFWCLAKSSQDAILWSLQTSDGDRRKRYYDIEGWVLGYPNKQFQCVYNFGPKCMNEILLCFTFAWNH